MSPASRHIVVFGSSNPRPGEPAWQEAFDVGRALAGAGYALVNGGYGGTMAASAAGAREAGGHVVGVTCTAFGRGGANEHVVEEVRTEDLYARLAGLIDRGDGYVALPGLTGTLVELAMVWELVAKRLIPQRPIVCLGDFWQPLIDTMTDAGAKRGHWLMRADDPAGVVAALDDWIARHE